MAYFVSLGIDINQTTNSKSTALHWCAFNGADLSLSFVLAWGAEVNCRDVKGKTPLHKAVERYENEESVKVIKILLIRGADRSALDFEGKSPLDYLKNKTKDAKAAKICALLTETWSVKSDFLMVRPAFKKQTRSSFTMFLYFLLMLLSYTCLWNSTYFVLYHAGRDVTLWTSNCLFLLCLVLAVSVRLTEPGQLKKTINFDFVEMLSKF